MHTTPASGALPDDEEDDDDDEEEPSSTQPPLKLDCPGVALAEGSVTTSESSAPWPTQSQRRATTVDAGAVPNVRGKLSTSVKLAL
jgi:hypothetical protein